MAPMPAEAPVTSAVFAFDIMELQKLGVALLMATVIIDIINDERH
jgi:H+/Cl- antiporter ClcA